MSRGKKPTFSPGSFGSKKNEWKALKRRLPIKARVTDADELVVAIYWHLAPPFHWV